MQYVFISSIPEYQISNVQCFEYPISSELYDECQIANVQYQKQSRFTFRYCALALYLFVLHIAATSK